VPSVLVNETAARQLWPGEEAVGKRLWQEKPYANDPATSEAYLAWLRERGLDSSMIGRAYEVVGVVADTVEYAGREVVAARYTEGFQPIIYRALEKVNGIEVAEPCLFVRTAVSPVTLSKPLARAINATGATVGMAVALATGRVLRAFLFGVSSSDPLTFVAVTVLLAAVALLACWLPARRATRINPTESLRYE